MTHAPDRYEDALDAPAIFPLADLTDVSLDVRFDLLSSSMTLKEIAQITSGQALDLDIDLQAPIDISIEGQRVGHGSLVKIGERICIQVTQWYLGGLKDD